MKKAVEILETGSSVILDWGFWTIKSRDEITKYFHTNNIKIEWHYIDVDDDVWNKSIEERNIRVEKWNCGFLATTKVKLDALEETHYIAAVVLELGALAIIFLS